MLWGSVHLKKNQNRDLQGAAWLWRLAVSWAGRNLSSVLVVEAPEGRSGGTVTRSSANEASGKPSFPATQLPALQCQECAVKMLNITIVVEVCPFIQLQDFLERLLGKMPKCKYLCPSSLPFSASAAKHSIFQDRHACLRSYNPDWLFLLSLSHQSKCKNATHSWSH